MGGLPEEVACELGLDDRHPHLRRSHLKDRGQRPQGGQGSLGSRTWKTTCGTEPRERKGVERGQAELLQVHPNSSPAAFRETACARAALPGCSGRLLVPAQLSQDVQGDCLCPRSSPGAFRETAYVRTALPGCSGRLLWLLV